MQELIDGINKMIATTNSDIEFNGTAISHNARLTKAITIPSADAS